MTSIARLLLVGSALACGIGTATAAERSISVPPESITVQGGAIKTSTVNLPKSSLGSIRIVFAVPADHAINTAIKVRIFATSASAPCDAVLRVATATRIRANQLSSNSIHPTVDRVEPSGSEVISFAATGAVNLKTYIVRTPLAASFNGLRAGDLIAIRFDRVVTEPTDTCAGFVFVQGADIRYTVAP